MARVTNKRRAEELLRRLSDLNYDPLMELIKIAKASKTKAELRKQIATEIMTYTYPKQKAVEMTHSTAPQVTFNIDLTGNDIPLESDFNDTESYN